MLRLREAERLAQGHTANMSQDSMLSLFDSKPHTHGECSVKADVTLSANALQAWAARCALLLSS